MQLNTDEEIHNALSSGEPICVVGLNERKLVQLQLPPGNDYIVMSWDQAMELARTILKHAETARLTS